MRKRAGRQILKVTINVPPAGIMTPGAEDVIYQ